VLPSRWTDTDVIISSTFTAEPVAPSLEYLLREIGIPEEVRFAPYNQVFQELLDPSRSFASNKKGVNVVLLRLEDWAGDNAGEDALEVNERIRRNASEFVDAVVASIERSSALHIVCICPPSNEFLTSSECAALLAHDTEELASRLSLIENALVLSPSDITQHYELGNFHDPISFRLGRVPYTQEFFTALGAAVARKIHSVRCNPYKVVVLDCDNTLWSGVVGEDGVAGLRLEAPHIELQKFVVAQQHAGMLVCLCSKNDERDVMEVFAQRPEMVLKLEHIVAHRINWSAKSQNLQALAAELNVGLDSFIFLDDDPAVCAEVRANCPDVLTVHLSAVNQIPTTLRHLWAFDKLKVTSEDAKRTELYRRNVERERVRQSAPTFQDFLQGLELRIEISPLARQDIPRVSQLTLRTNQFNFTTIRRSEADIAELIDKEGYEGLAIRVSDRFGDYGLVGTVIYKSDATLHADSFLLSCRVLGRGVEHKIISHLGRTALERGLPNVELAFVPSAKNQVAREFLASALVEFCETAPSGFVYRIPAERAAAMVCTEAHPSAVVEEGGAGSVQPSATTSRTRADALATIAKELSDVRAIMEKCSIGTSVASLKETDLGDLPADDLEQALAQIWEEVLGIPRVGRNADFEELGGDSLTAVRLFARIEEKMGRALPLTAIMDAPTIARLADLLRRSQAPTPAACLVPLQPNGSNPPLYCMHAAGGNVLFYRDLARHLGNEQPVHGFQAYGLNGKTPPHTRVEDMARHYIREMREFQPEGPYYLGGSSFGGLVAFEMARQLAETDQEVGILALFDTYGPGYPKYLASTTSLKKSIYRLVQRLQHHWSDLRLLPNDQRITYIGAKAQKARNRFRRKWRRNKSEIARKFHERTGRPLPEKLRKTQNSISCALERYRFGSYNGEIVLFRASNQPIGIEPNPTLGWETIVGDNIRVYEVPGFHGAITVDPHAQFLASELRACLGRAFQGNRRTEAAMFDAMARKTELAPV
jgi:FkbH-like protein